MEKKDKFSIRKIKGVVGSILLMSIFVPIGMANASEFHYIDKSSLSEVEKSQIINGLPTNDENNYILIYEKNSLPNTGTQKNYILTTLGIFTLGSLLLIVNNKKKTFTLLLVTTIGLTSLSSANALDLSNNIHEVSTEGVIDIKGYHYIGYLKIDNSSKIEELEQKENILNYDKVESEKGTPEIIEKPELEVPTEVLKPEIQPEKETKNIITYMDSKGNILDDNSNKELPNENPKFIQNEKYVYTGKSETENGITKHIYDEVKSEKGLPESIDKPKFELPEEIVKPEIQPEKETKNIITYMDSKGNVLDDNTNKELSQEIPKFIQNEKYVYTGKSEIEDGITKYIYDKVQSEKGTPEIVEKPELEVSTEALKPEIQHEKENKEITIYKDSENNVLDNNSNKELPENPPKFIQNEKYVYTGKSEIEDGITKHIYDKVKSEKGVPEIVEKPELEVSTEALKPEIQPEKEIKNIITYTDSKGNVLDDNIDKELPNENPKFIQNEKYVYTGKSETEDGITKHIYDEVKSEKGEPEKLELPERTEIETPKLTLLDSTENVMDKTVKLDYKLENKDNVTIKKIKVEVIEGNNKIKEVDLTDGNLSNVISDLKLYKDYKIKTTLIYNKGIEDEELSLEERPFKLELKKVEIKDIKSTQLIKVNENKEEIDDTNFTTIPTDKNNYYLKITTNDNKTNRLAVKSITEETVKGENFYKITAEATDLIQHNKEEQIQNEYTYYIAKPKQKENNVYYDFGELIEAIQNNPEGDYKIGQSLNATNIKPKGKSYITKKFKGTLTSTDGNKFAIHNLANPLFNEIENATIKDLIFSNVNINKPDAEQIATLGKDATNTTIENIKITGSIVGSNDVAGVVNNLNDRSRMKNVAVIGKLHTEGKKGWSISGLVNNQRKANIEKVYTDVEITGEKARGSALVSTLDRGADPMDVRANGHIKKAVAKGSINLKSNVDTGGVISKNWPYGFMEDVISYVKVNNAEKLYGSKDIEDNDFGYPYLSRVFSVTGEATGNVTRKNANKLKEISKEEADRKLEEFGITAKDFVAPTLLVDKLNNTISKDDEYKTTQDYDKTREQAYRNIAKLQPFYNKEWIVNQGNKLTNENLLNKKVISVIGMRDNEFITDLSEANKILVHYSDKTKDIFTVSPKESNVSQIKEYTINELKDIVYTPNMIEKNRSSIASKIKEKLNSVELQSDGVYNLMDKRNNTQENTTERRKGYVRDLFLEESFEEVKNNLDSLVNKLLLNYDFQLNGSKASEDVLLQKIENNKEKIMLGLAYLNRYYGINFGNMNIKEIMLFKPDFYGKNVNFLDFLIKIGSNERNVKGDRTLESYRENIGGTLGIDELNGFLHYNMNLLTGYTDINDWFKDATKKNVYIVEPETSTEEFKNKKHRAYDGLNNDVHSRMILPLLNLKKAHIFLISTYNTMAYSAFEKYGKNTEEARNEFKKEIDKVAKAQQNYLDFWSRLASDKVRNQLLKSQNVVPSPVWDNMNAQGYGWLDKYGHKDGLPDYAPSRELFGPTGRYFPPNWNMGAMAKIWGDPYKEESVYYMVTDMISDFGISAFTHETTHINDRMAYLGGWRHREGTFVEAFAQGMLQSPSVSNPNGEYGALGLNMAYERENDGKQWYNYNPNKLKNRQEIDDYMKRYNEAMMLLDYAEAEAVLSKGLTDNSQWFKKVDRKMREKGSYNNNLVAPNQWDLVRDLNDNEKTIKLNTIKDLVNNNFATKHGVGNGVFKPEDFTPNSSYVTVNMMAGIYGGNTSDGAVGALSFKHNTFRMWGYFGYEKGFVGYASNKYKDIANKENKGLLSDKLIIQKVSEGKFNTLEEWKNSWYEDIHDKAKTKGFVPITIDNKQISSYERLKELFNEAVQKDLDELSNQAIKNKYRHTVSLKEKVFKQLLKESDGFSNPFFKS